MRLKFKQKILPAAYFIFFLLTSAKAIDRAQLYNKIDYYISKYGLKCLGEKITDNFGNGCDSLYGTRNMRTVLYGIVYRGGANNFYDKYNKRNNHNPLPGTGLRNLCRQGFSTAVYLYKTNYDSSVKSVEDTLTGNKLEYLDITGESNESIHKILNLVYEDIVHPDRGPIYIHCWNGWHQSGLISALILMQFCDYTPAKAYRYWLENTDGVKLKTDKIERVIESFKPYRDFKIDSALESRICPCMGKHH